MSRGMIVGIVLVTFGGLTVSSAWAQEGRSSDSGGFSLAERLASLRGALRRDESPKTKPAKRNARSSRQRGASKQRPGGPTGSQLQKQNNSGPRTSLPRVRAGDLLPEGMFSRTTTGSNRPGQSYPTQIARTASLPRVGSASSLSSSNNPSRASRKSPTTKRENELEAALADLLPASDAEATDQALSDVLDGPLLEVASQRSKANRSTGSRKTFDLRAALLSDDLGETIAEEVAKSSAPDLVATDRSRAADAQSEVEATPDAAPEPEPKTAVTIAPPAAEPTPVRASPLAAKPQRRQPSITTAVVDPFDRAAEKAFGQPQQKPNFASTKAEDSQPSFVDQRDSKSAPSLLQTQRQPVIISQVEGPRSILVGREASYQVTLQNTSDIAAGQISATIRVPQWAELVEVMSTSGAVERAADGTDPGHVEWRLRALAARSKQTLQLRLIPRSGRPMQLAVQWSQAPVQTQTLVEVQEPKLEMSISGPQKVLFGKPQRFRLALRNPGTGVAENVSIRLVPPGGDPENASVQTIGDLGPGQLREIELELTARDAGDLVMQATAKAEGGLEAKAVMNVLCRKPELEVDWRGPDKKYAGTVAAYYFRIRNPGTATTDPVELTIKLPPGASYVAATDGHVHNPQTGVISWQLGGIGAKQEQFIQLRCEVTQPGDNNFEIVAQTKAHDLRDSVVFQTNVVALADLKLAVSDPQGPVPVGEVISYEIRVVNRGSSAAEGVNIVGLFSEGIDPTSVEGAQYTLRDGRVTFHPIKTLPAGHEVVLRIRAKASQIGTHIFRAEVVCQVLDIKLAAEETTRFFKDEYRWEDGPTAYSAATQSDQPDAAVNR